MGKISPVFYAVGSAVWQKVCDALGIDGNGVSTGKAPDIETAVKMLRMLEKTPPGQPADAEYIEKLTADIRQRIREAESCPGCVTAQVKDSSVVKNDAPHQPVNRFTSMPKQNRRRSRSLWLNEDLEGSGSIDDLKENPFVTQTPYEILDDLRMILGMDRRPPGTGGRTNGGEAEN